MESKGGTNTTLLAAALVIALLAVGFGGYEALQPRSSSGVTVTSTIPGPTTTKTMELAGSATVPLESAGQAVEKTISVGQFFFGPQGIAFNPTSNEIYVALENNASVAVVNATSGSLITGILLPSGDSPVGLAYDSANNMVYVANDDSSTCSPSTNSTCTIPVINSATNTVVANIQTPDETSDVAVNPSTNVVYAASNDDDAVFFVNAATNQFAGILQNHTALPDNSEVVAVDSSKNLAFIANSYYHSQPLAGLGFMGSMQAGGCLFTTTNESSGCLTKDLGVLGGKIDSVAVNPTTGMIYVANYNLGLVNVFSESSGTDVANITVPSPAGIAVDPSTNMVFVASNTTTTALNDSLFVINGATNTVMGAVIVGGGPANVAVDTNNSSVIVSSASAGTISIIDESNLHF